MLEVTLHTAEGLRSHAQDDALAPVLALCEKGVDASNQHIASANKMLL